MEGVAAAIILQPVVKEFVKELVSVSSINQVSPSEIKNPARPILTKQEAVAITEADRDFIERQKNAKYQVARKYFTVEEMEENLKRHQENKDRMLQEQVRALFDRIATT
jgi:hypothetical protein